MKSATKAEPRSVMWMAKLNPPTLTQYMVRVAIEASAINKQATVSYRLMSPFTCAPLPLNFLKLFSKLKAKSK